MNHSTGLSGAAPIWSDFMQAAAPQLAGSVPTDFVRPDGLINKVICSISGSEPSNYCKSGKKTEIFAADQLPLPPGMDLWRKVNLDTWSQFERSDACDEFTKKEMVMRVDDTWARKWLATKSGRNWLESHGFPKEILFAPSRECRESDPQPDLRFTNLEDGDTITDKDFEIFGVVTVSDNFGNWTLDFGEGAEPTGWVALVEKSDEEYKKSEELVKWDMDELENGIFSLRLTLRGDKGNAVAERIIRVTLDLPIPTPTPTITPTSTATSPPTFTVTPTLLPPTETFTPTITYTPTITDTPQPPTETFTPEPIETATPTVEIP